MFRFVAALAVLGAASPALADHGPDWPEREFRTIEPQRHLARLFSRDDGYFQGRGTGVMVAGGKALFDYDRDYPYDFPANWGRGAARGQSRIGYISEPDIEEERSFTRHCAGQPVRDARSGGSTTVRICR